jgi:fused signal recognition particle receptor
MSLFKRLLNAVRTGTVSQDQWDEIRSALITADLGVKLADQVIEQAKSTKPDNAKQVIKEQLSPWLSKKNRKLTLTPNSVSTILIVGVNGTGKTTTTAKLANLIKNEGNKVLLAAADTFRAAAVDQLQTWANRIDIDVVTGAANGDPASVAFSAISKAKSEKYDCLIVDTAGRLHTKNNLMSELEKIIKVIEKQSPINEVLLVIDATTGQNGINQEFY